MQTKRRGKKKKKKKREREREIGCIGPRFAYRFTQCSLRSKCSRKSRNWASEIVSISSLYQIIIQNFKFGLKMENEKYSRELNVGVRVVHMACALCTKLQEQLLISPNFDQIRSKDDDSLVTVAGN